MKCVLEENEQNVFMDEIQIHSLGESRAADVKTCT